MIKDVEERQKALDMRLSNAPKFYFYEACLITMRAIIRLARRYAELAREMAAKENDAARKAELIAIAETCEWVPEHPARNLREAIQCHFLCHISAEIEQVGCGYSEAYLGQNLEPFYQRDKAAGLIGPEEATYLLESLFVKLNEIGYYYGETGGPAELRRPGPEHHPRRLHRDRGGRHRGDGLPGPRRVEVPDAAAAAADLLLHQQDERQVPREGPRRHRHRRRHAAVRQRGRDDQARPQPLREQQERPHTRQGPADLHRCLRGELHPVRDRSPRGGPAQPGQDPRAHHEQRVRPAHQEADRSPDRGSRELQELRRAVRSLRGSAPVLRGHAAPRGVDRQHPVRRVPAGDLALHPDRGLHRERHRGLEWRGQLLHRRTDHRRRSRRRERPDGGEAPRLRHEEADDGRAEEGAGGELRGRVREGRQALLRGSQARQRHPRGQPDGPQGVREHLPGLPERGRRRQLHQRGESARRPTPTPRASTT